MRIRVIPSKRQPIEGAELSLDYDELIFYNGTTELNVNVTSNTVWIIQNKK